MLKFLLLLIGINSASLFSILTTNTKTQVHLHLERFNDDLNLYHIGISFKNNNSVLRYDYRPFCEPNKCEFKTVNSVTSVKAVNKEVTLVDKLYRFYIPENVPNKTIYWGETTKSLEDVEEFEKTLQKKYILGINDCRHYVNRISLWALNKRTPIWSLDKLWNQSYA